MSRWVMLLLFVGLTPTLANGQGTGTAGCWVPIEINCNESTGIISRCAVVGCNFDAPVIPQCYRQFGLEVVSILPIPHRRTATLNEHGYTNWVEQSWVSPCGMQYICNCYLDEPSCTNQEGSGVPQHPIQMFPSGPKNCFGDFQSGM